MPLDTKYDLLIGYLNNRMYDEARAYITALEGDDPDRVATISDRQIVEFLHRLKIYTKKDFLARFERVEELLEYPNMGVTRMEKVKQWLNENPRISRSVQ